MATIARTGAKGKGKGKGSGLMNRSMQSRGTKGSGKGARKGGGKGAFADGGASAADTWRHDKFEGGDEDGFFAHSRNGPIGGGGRASSKGPGQGWRSGGGGYSGSDMAPPRGADRRDGREGSKAEQLLTQEDRRMMKKITIVAQLDKVPKPPPAMQGLAAFGGGRDREG